MLKTGIQEDFTEKRTYELCNEGRKTEQKIFLAVEQPKIRDSCCVGQLSTKPELGKLVCGCCQEVREANRRGERS